MTPAQPQPASPPALAGAEWKALEAAALRQAPALFRLAARLTGSAADGEDVLQEAFTRAVAELRAGTFRGEAQLSTWLYRVVTHAALDRVRHAKQRERSAPRLAEEEAAAGASGETAVALRELADAMAGLPDDQRAALVLKEVQGLSTREVAEVLERSEGATEQLLVRARQALRKRFEP